MHLPFQVIDSLGRGDLSLAAALLRNNDAANGTRSSVLITTTNAASDDVLWTSRVLAARHAGRRPGHSSWKMS